MTADGVDSTVTNPSEVTLDESECGVEKKPKEDPPCSPPEGTRCYVEDAHNKGGKTYEGYEKFMHYHIMQMQRRRSGDNGCYWGLLRDKIGVGKFPVLDLGAMLPCSAYGAGRS